MIKVYNIKSKRGISKELSFLDEECISDKMVLLFGTEIDGKCELKSFFEKGEQIACVNLYEDDEKTAINVINQFFQENNKQIEASAVKAIAEMLHGDRKALLCECEKMLMYCNDKNITLNDVEIAIESEQASNSIAFASLGISFSSMTSGQSCCFSKLHISLSNSCRVMLLTATKVFASSLNLRACWLKPSLTKIRCSTIIP